MAIYPAWDQLYGIGLQATWGTAIPTGTSLSDTYGGLEVIGYPDFTSGLEVIDTRKATGVPYRKTIEYLQGTKSPGVTLEMEASPRSLIPFLFALFHTVTEAATPFEKIFTIYASHPDFTGKSASALTSPGLFTLVRNTGVTAESHQLTNCIVRSMTLSGEQGQPLKMSVEVIATTLSTAYTLTTDDFTFPTTQNTAIMFHDLYLRLDGSVASRANSFSITMSNNAVVKHQAGAGNQNVTGFVLGDFTVTGSLSIPWGLSANENAEIEKFTDGTSSRPTDTLIEICNANDYACNLAGEFLLKTNVRYTAVPLGESDNEMTLDLSIEGVDDVTNAVARIEVSDGLDWTLPAP